MPIEIDQAVMLPGYQPFPRYGRVTTRVDEERVMVTQVACGDPRCASEHQHADVVWNAAELEAAQAYQPRAEWEHGRKSSPNTPVES